MLLEVSYFEKSNSGKLARVVRLAFPEEEVVDEQATEKMINKKIIKNVFKFIFPPLFDRKQLAKYILYNIRPNK